MKWIVGLKSLDVDGDDTAKASAMYLFRRAQIHRHSIPDKRDIPYQSLLKQFLAELHPKEIMEVPA